MPASPKIHAVFGHFQNLNLLALREDLLAGRTARQAWHAGLQLCPVAHGLPYGSHVQQLRVLGQEADLQVGCEFAARQLGADPGDVLRFVRWWDEETGSTVALLRYLDAMWHERLEDAEAVQAVLRGGPSPARGRVAESNPEVV
jgi:hypothetical protein